MLGTIIAVLVLLYWLVMFFAALWGLPKIPRMVERYEAATDEPFVSVIVAAKDEADSIKQTVQGLLRLDYSNYEVIVVNDRSEDATSDQLREVEVWAKEEGVRVPLQILPITHLPQGWLGKNHALYQGYLQAKGDYLLFTDADIVYRPHTLRSAMAFVQQEKVDHLTLGPHMVTRTPWLRAFVNFFLFSLCLIKQPWKPNDDKQHREGFGIGAFNFLSRDAYEKIGTHKTIAMRPDDDLMLGMKVKQARLKQRLVAGHDLISVEWYPSLRAAVQGLEKNMFAGLNYNLALLIIGVLGQFLFFIYPFLALWFTAGWQVGAYGLSIGLAMFLYLYYGWKMGGKPGFEVIGFPIASATLIFILLRSTFLTYKNGGIYWRGTFYSLRELKAMKTK